jgi:hypothetical protein
VGATLVLGYTLLFYFLMFFPNLGLGDFICFLGCLNASRLWYLLYLQGYPFPSI